MAGLLRWASHAGRLGVRRELLVGGCGVAASLARPFWSDASWTAASAGAVVLASSVALAATALKLRSLTLGLLTAFALLLAFWTKWMLGSEPLTYFQPVAHDNDAAIQVTAAFSICFAITWVAGERMARRQQPIPWSRLPGPGSVWFVFALGCAMVALRPVAAQVWVIGVPGQVPTGPDFPAAKSLIYYSSVYAPLACAMLVLLVGRSKTTRVLGGVLLLLYAAAGAVAGSRGAIVAVVVVVVFVASKQLQAPLRTDGGSRQRRLSLRVLCLWLSAAAAVFAVMAFTLNRRSAGSDSSSLRGTINFVFDRIGGLDFRSVAVSGVDRLGTSWTHLDSSNWISFLTYDVYGYPREAVTGAASTLPGLAYGVSGWGTVFAAGLMFGLLAGLADGRLTSDARPAASCLHLGLVIAWPNLLLEGTTSTAAFIILYFMGISAVTALFPAFGGQVTVPQTRLTNAKSTRSVGGRSAGEG